MINKELKIGLFAVAVLIVSFFLINYLRDEDLFNREFELSARYDDVEGLVASAPVYIKGYKAGKVSEVIYDSDTENFEVICSVSKDFRVPSDSRMTIYSVDLMGGKGIRIDFGQSEVAAADGDQLRPSYEAGLVDGLAAGLTPLMDKASSVLDSLSVTAAAVNRLLSAENISSVSATLGHLETTMERMRNMSTLVDGKSAELSSFIDDLSVISSRLVSMAGEMDGIVAGANDVVSSLSDAELGELIASFRELLDSMNDPDGTIGKILTDVSLYDSLESLLADVDSLVMKIQENPKKYLRISIF